MANSLAWISVSAFSPSDVAGLRMWYKPESLSAYADGVPIDTWADSSGNGFDMTQSGVNRPVKDDSDPSANNQPNAVFTAGLSYMITVLATSNLVNGDKQTAYLVMNDSSTSGFWWQITASDGSRNQVQNVSGSPSVIAYDSTDTSGGRLIDNDAGTGLHIWEFYRNGANIDITKDGTSLGSSAGASGTLLNESQAFVFGTANVTGPVFEFINYNVGISSGNRTSVIAYLKTKYAIP